jgi:regulator of protease activity HflC (stomatin/prohibitin superfamily)
MLGLFVVKQQSCVIIERLGKYKRTAHAGVNWKNPFIDHIVATRWLRIMQLDIRAETKTKDNVFVTANVSVQHRILAENAAASYYQLQDGDKQMTSFVLDVVRSTIPTMTLDEVFEHKDKVATDVRTALSGKMRQYGYEITDVLIPEIDPDIKVKNAMNEIQANQRLQVAATAKGEADKAILVKKAEAEAEAMRLQGEGMANQRKAIAQGLKDSVELLKQATGVDAKEVMANVLLTSYLETIRDIGVSANSKVLMLPNGPSGVHDFYNQIRNALVAGEESVSK